MTRGLTRMLCSDHPRTAAPADVTTVVGVAEEDVMICGRCGQPVRLSIGNGRQAVDVSSFLAHHRACVTAPQGTGTEESEPEVAS